MDIDIARSFTQFNASLHERSATDRGKVDRLRQPAFARKITLTAF
jgi:hypothetical protein